jgi:sugar phosphate isomerase/epimerase
MELKGIGIDVDDGRVHGNLEILAADLEFFARCGFDAVELTTTGLFFILNGTLHAQRARSISQLLKRFPFRYTLHLPDCLNLASSAFPALERNIFAACIEFAGLVGAELLVYHCGLSFLHVDSSEKRREAALAEVEALRSLAEAAQRSGILVTVENSDPEPGEVALISARGLGPDELRVLHPALYLDGVAEQVRRAGSPNLGLTLDPGHLFLAAQLTGESFLDSIERNAPLVRHLHLNDNFGRNSVSGHNRMEQALYGEADCHLPLGLGAIPLPEVLRRLASFSGYVIFEMRPEYRDFLPHSIAWLKEHVPLGPRSG